MLSIIKQTDQTIKLNFDEDGEPLDITGYEILFTVKKQEEIKEDDDVALISKDITEHTDPTQGETELVLTNEDTNIEAGKYYYDIRLVKDGKISQTEKDEIEIVENVTKRTS